MTVKIYKPNIKAGEINHKVIKQRTQSGVYVPHNANTDERNHTAYLEPIITMGATSISATDNTYRVREFRGYPSIYPYYVKKEYQTGDKETQKQIKRVIGEAKGLISKSFCTFVHKYYLKVNKKSYSKEMSKYIKNEKLYPVITRDTLIMELSEILESLLEGKKLSIEKRTKLPLYSKRGMPLLSIDATVEMINKLKYEFPEVAIGFLRIDAKYPIKISKVNEPKDQAEFIESKERFQLSEEMKQMVMWRVH